MSSGDLKRLLSSRNVSYVGVTEKYELVDLALFGAGGGVSGAAAAAAASATAAASAAAAEATTSTSTSTAASTSTAMDLLEPGDRVRAVALAEVEAELARFALAPAAEKTARVRRLERLHALKQELTPRVSAAVEAAEKESSGAAPPATSTLRSGALLMQCLAEAKTRAEEEERDMMDEDDDDGDGGDGGGGAGAAGGGAASGAGPGADTGGWTTAWRCDGKRAEGGGCLRGQTRQLRRGCAHVRDVRPCVLSSARTCRHTKCRCPPKPTRITPFQACAPCSRADPAPS
jgi:hypothetical protein